MIEQKLYHYLYISSQQSSYIFLFALNEPIMPLSDGVTAVAAPEANGLMSSGKIDLTREPKGYDRSI